MPLPGGEQRQAAERDPQQDRGGPGDLLRAEGVAEDHHACRGADERLEVDEGPGDLGGHPDLTVGEEREGQQRSAER